VASSGGRGAERAVDLLGRAAAPARSARRSGGAFVDGRGNLHGDDTHEGKPIKAHFIWSGITLTSARREQEFSDDGGATGESNWVMEFVRVDRAGGLATSSARQWSTALSRSGPFCWLGAFVDAYVS
jgi:hypothetical protein